MQDLLKFIVKYSNLLVLLALEVVAFLLLLSNNHHPRSTILSTANRLVAAQYEAVHNINSYFSLHYTNELLQAENAHLRAEVEQLQTLVSDSMARSAAEYLHHSIRYIPSRVINTDSRLSHNYLTIGCGSNMGVRSGMGVICSDGVVGIVSTVSQHYAIVVPVIHTDASISCMFSKNGYIGTLRWPGDNYRYARMEDVALHVDVLPGDTLVTSGLTTAFPKGIPVGVVDQCDLEDGESYYTVRVQLSTDFRRLDYVQVVDNRSADEIEALKHGLD